VKVDTKYKTIAAKDNLATNMLSRARYDGEEDMVDEEEDVGSNFYSTSSASKEGLCLAIPLKPFLEESYEREWLHIGRHLRTLQRKEGWTNEEFKRFWKKAFGYFL
jgi:hypothetical protein